MTPETHYIHDDTTDEPTDDHELEAPPTPSGGRRLGYDLMESGYLMDGGPRV